MLPRSADECKGFLVVPVRFLCQVGGSHPIAGRGAASQGDRGLVSLQFRPNRKNIERKPLSGMISQLVRQRISMRCVLENSQINWVFTQNRPYQAGAKGRLA